MEGTDLVLSFSGFLLGLLDEPTSPDGSPENTTGVSETVQKSEC